jgi:hypothetical protein
VRRMGTERWTVRLSVGPEDIWGRAKSHARSGRLGSLSTAARLTTERRVKVFMHRTSATEGRGGLFPRHHQRSLVRQESSRGRSASTEEGRCRRNEVHERLTTRKTAQGLTPRKKRMIMSSIFDRTGGFDIKKNLERIRKTASRAEREQRRIASGQPCLRRELKEEQRQNM